MTLHPLGRRTRLAALRNRHAGQRCVIVANGPSLNRMDLSPLRGEHAIGLNKIYLGLPGFGFSPRYHVAINPTVVQQARQALGALPCVKFIGSRAAQHAGVPDGPLTHIVNTHRPPARFSTDLCQGLHEGWTVTYAALQVAWHLGFAEVVLIGLDHRYHFQGQPNEARVMHGPDPNHFSGDYFGHGQSWDNPDLSRSEESYRIALAQFQGAGRRIVDATLDGACTVFPKAPWPQVLG